MSFRLNQGPGDIDPFLKGFKMITRQNKGKLYL